MLRCNMEAESRRQRKDGQPPALFCQFHSFSTVFQLRAVLATPSMRSKLAAALRLAKAVRRVDIEHLAHHRDVLVVRRAAHAAHRPLLPFGVAFKQRRRAANWPARQRAETGYCLISFAQSARESQHDVLLEAEFLAADGGDFSITLCRPSLLLTTALPLLM